jgi:uncharacterized membrane protein
VSYFRLVRLYSAAGACLLIALLVVWIGDVDEQAKLVLGWCHGVGWLILCALVFAGCVRRVFSWPVFAATVSPLGPIAATIAIELDARRRRSATASRVI